MRPAFDLGTADANAPPGLLEPIREYHEGFLMRDWTRVAKAWPDFDRSTADRAHQFDEEQERDFGSWVYVREVDAWWSEGRRAHVSVRGVEHAVLDEGEPGRNAETVIDYGLRRAGSDWVIDTLSQDWPSRASGMRAPRPCRWLDEWELDEWELDED